MINYQDIKYDNDNYKFYYGDEELPIWLERDENFRDMFWVCSDFWLEEDFHGEVWKSPNAGNLTNAKDAAKKRYLAYQNKTRAGASTEVTDAFKLESGIQIAETMKNVS